MPSPRPAAAATTEIAISVPARRRRRLAPWLLSLALAGVTSGCLLSGSSSQPAASNQPPAAEAQANAPDSAAEGAKDAGKPAHPAFDAARAFKQLEKQVAFGPRVPNLPSHRECRDYLVDTLRSLADSVELQDCSRKAADGKNLEMSNIVARWKGTGKNAAEKGVLLCAHWDTRPTADYERTAARRKTPIPGANDGASGVAVLLEAARLFKQSPPPVPVMIVFFDGEDVGPGIDQMFFGSKHFAANLPADVPRRGILLDMVGDRELRIPQEQYSAAKAADVVAQVYGIAHDLGYQKEFPAEVGQAIEDDHVPLQKRGLQIIDLIDFDYGPNHTWWHTLEDTPDKCSPKSLKAVGDTVVGWVYSQGK